MARSTGTRGNVTPYIQLSNLSGSPSAIAPGDDAISVNLVDGDSDNRTFSDYSSGNASKALECEFIYSGATGSIFDVLWNNSGRTGVSVTWSPTGNSVAAAGKPVFSGTCTLPPKPNLETEAGTDEYSFTVTIQLDSYTRTTA